MNTLRRWGFVLLMLAAWPVKRTAAWLRKASRWGFLMFVSFSALGSAPDLKVGDVPPDVFGKSSNGEAVHLSDYQGKIVVISFWATWCGPCRKELPMLVNLEKMATREKVVVISVNWRQNRDVFREIKGLFKKMDTDITLVSDPFGLAGTAYHVKGIPHMVIVGKDGKITAIHVGYDEAELPILVDELNSELLKTPSEGPTPKELPGIESIQSEPVDVEGEAE